MGGGVCARASGDEEVAARWWRGGWRPWLCGRGRARWWGCVWAGTRGDTHAFAVAVTYV